MLEKIRWILLRKHIWVYLNLSLALCILLVLVIVSNVRRVNLYLLHTLVHLLCLNFLRMLALIEVVPIDLLYVFATV